jgi:hypothetical protein
MDIQTEHMKQRCYFVSAMCGMSLYTWYYYSLFDPINNSFFTPYYQNGMVFLYYLAWDTYHMMTKPILFRTDLMLHHTMSFIIATFSINNNTLQMSNYMILECISLMNYIWRNNPKLLRAYRTVCICVIRIPLVLWFYYYSPIIMYPYWEHNLTYNHCLFVKRLFNTSSVFFLFYDIFILWKLYKPIKHKRLL